MWPTSPPIEGKGIKEVGVRLEVVQRRRFLNEDEDVFGVCHAGGNRPFPFRISFVGAGDQHFFQVAPLGRFQEAFIDKLLARRLHPQFGDPQLKSSDNNSACGAVVLENHFVVTLQLDVEHELHRGQELVFRVLKE